jgi:hypothetical protein
MDQRISPSKFSKLPPELQSKIFRQKGLTVTKQHQNLILIEERIEDAGTKPLTEEEASFLYGSKTITIFSEIGKGWGNGESFEAITIPPDYPNVRLHTIDNFINGLDESGYKIKDWRTHASKNQELKEGMIHNLTEVKLSNLNFSKIKYFYAFGIGMGRHKQRNSDVVLLDLSSIFTILSHRFTIVLDSSLNDARVIKLSREYTLEVLNNIVDLLAPPKEERNDKSDSYLRLLLLYLAVNAEIFGLVLANTYFKEGPITKEYIDEIEDNCEELYEMLKLYIEEL